MTKDGALFRRVTMFNTLVKNHTRRHFSNPETAENALS